MKPTAENVERQGKLRKRKRLRGVIRERVWTDGDGKPQTAWQADFGTVNGKRLRKSCETKADAENWLHEQRLMLEDQGHAAFRLTDAERMDAVRARDILGNLDWLPKLNLLEHVARSYTDALAVLDGTADTLMAAVRFYEKHRPPTGERRTVSEVIAEYVADARENNLRPRSVADIEERLRRLAAVHGDRLINEVTRKDADNWLRSFKVSPVTRRHFRTVAHGLFNFAIDQEYVRENPFAGKRHRRRQQEDEAMPTCMAWRDVQKIMAAAVERQPSMVPALAIGFFAGLRTAELRGLDWKDVDLEARRITVLPEVAKKRRARHVYIEDNLMLWLMPYRLGAGLVAPDNGKWRARLDTVREKAGVAWPSNAMRHSYASHHLVKHGDAAKTALQLGHHRDTSMLFDHYRALVKPEDARDYFDIRPVEAGNVIAFKATA